MEYNILELQEEVKGKLSPKRYLHTLGVQYTCASLAMVYQEDIIKAQVAGLFHDYARCISGEMILEECLKYKIPVTAVERENKYLLHGKLGAFYAKYDYGISDEDILSAITFHTTGRPNMSLLEKILYIADFIEPSRKEIPGLKRIRQLSYQSLDQAVYQTLESTISYLEQTKKSGNIDAITMETYTFYKYSINDKEKI